MTKHGRSFVELVSARTAAGMDFDKAAVVRRELGLDGLDVGLAADFDDSALGYRVLGRPG